MAGTLSETAVLQADSRVVREVAFFGEAGARMLGLASLPAEGIRGGVVICSSVLAEFSRNYRREQLLSSALAARGVAVLRFQYRGTGNSDGDPAQQTLDSMLDDARMAVDHLVGRAAPPALAFLGTRLGGLVAATVAGEHAGAPLALWEPVSDPDAYVREILRARLISDLRRRGGAGVSAAGLLDELRRNGSVEILGYCLSRDLYESLAGRSLSQVLGLGQAALLLVQFSRRKELRREYAELLSRCRNAGRPVTSWVFPGEEAWWFTDDAIDKTVAGARPLLDLTADWLVARFGAEEMGP